MKKTKRLLSFILAGMMLISTVGCSNKGKGDLSGEALFKAGTYEAVGQGLGGDVKVQVVLSDEQIQSVQVVSHQETEGISDPAIKNIPDNIVAAQGLKIDVVAGATITSNAILEAVTACLTEAGADIEGLKEKGLEDAVLEDETLDTDVVVVGGGMAGLTAAISAANEGAKVILVEKMAALGGASIVCGGEVIASGTEMQEQQGIEDSPEALAEYWNESGDGKLNEEYLSFIAQNSADTVEWLADNGIKFGDVTFSYNYPNQTPLRNHKTEDGTGAGLINPLTESAKAAGVEILLETPAVSLINENGEIKGIVAENAGRTVTINAKSTILATGGYANNEELMNEYAPKIGAFGTFLGEAHQGDGLIMARDAGAEIVANGGAIANPSDTGATKYIDAGGFMLNVTPEGKRYANETEYWFTRSGQLYMEEGFNKYFGIMDSKLEHEKLEEAVEAGSIVKADTIEELANKIDIDPAVLVATVNRYNEMCKTGNDVDFGKPAIGKVGSTKDRLVEMQLLNSIENGPFYAVRFETNNVTGTFGGPKVTIDGEVVSTTGDIIKGLYAAGEVANGELFNESYPCSGTSIQFCATMGRQAGTAAAKASK